MKEIRKMYQVMKEKKIQNIEQLFGYEMVANMDGETSIFHAEQIFYFKGMEH